MPQISVIIPLFNRAHYIVETLKSIEDQQLMPYEVIIVDDFSTDNSAEVVKKYADRTQLNIKIVSNEHKKGSSGALNTGIDKSAGDFIAFQDSDDLWTPIHLKQLAEALARYPQVSMAFSAIEIFGVAQDAEQKRRDFQASVKRCRDISFEKVEANVWLSNQRLFYAILNVGFPFRCQASMIRKDFILKHNLFFDEDLTYTQESQYATFAAYNTAFIYVDNVGSKIRRHQENDGDKNYGEKIEQSYEIRVLKLRRYFSDKKLNSSEKKSLKVRLWILQEEVLRRRSKKGSLLTKIIECWRLMQRIPCFLSIKSVVKIFINK